MLDDVTGSVNVSGTFTGLTGTATMAHIHGLAPDGVIAGVIVNLTPTFGAMSGTILGHGVVPPEQISGMLNGQTYVDVHSSFAPGGEIRGQAHVVASVPALAPWSLAFLAASLAGAGVWLFGRRRGATTRSTAS
jgi:hypothetical protein